MQEKRTIADRIRISKCRVLGKINGEEEELSECPVEIREEEISKKIRMKNGVEYTARRSAYTLVVCECGGTGITFEKLEKIESFKIIIHIKDIFGEDPRSIEDAIPLDINLNGRWVFKLSETEGAEIAKAYRTAKKELETA